MADHRHMPPVPLRRSVTRAPRRWRVRAGSLADGLIVVGALLTPWLLQGWLQAWLGGRP